MSRPVVRYHGAANAQTQALTFTVPGRPEGWKRTTSVNGRRLTPKTMRAYKATVAQYAAWAMSQQRFALVSRPARVGVVLDVFTDTPGADADNYAKIVCDALNEVAYDDDKQVDDLHINVVRGVRPKTKARLDVRVWAL